MAAVDFFISYTRTDEPWARWLVWLLESRSFTTFARYKNIKWGQNTEVVLDEALKAASRFIVVLSPDYRSNPDVAQEWTAVTKKDPNGSLGILLPLKVKPYEDTGLLGNAACLTLSDLDEMQAISTVTGALIQLNLWGQNSAPGPSGDETNTLFPYDRYQFQIEHCDSEAKRVDELLRDLESRGRKAYRDLWKTSGPFPVHTAPVPPSIRVQCRVVCLGQQTPAAWARQRIKDALFAEASKQVRSFLPILFPGADESFKQEFNNVFVWADAGNALDRLQDAISEKPMMSSASTPAPDAKAKTKTFLDDLQHFAVSDRVREEFERKALEEYWKELHATR